MEIQLQELIDQIKKDGVEVAESEAADIIANAKAEAEKIVAEARAQADKILATAKAETEKMTKSSEDAIRQAGRNLLISFRESITKQLDLIVGEKVSQTYSSDDFAKLIIRVVENWANNPDAEDIAVILSAEDLATLENTVRGAIKEKLLTGVSLKANDNFSGGFRIGVNNGSAYYDYSKDAVVDMLSNYLSPKVTALLKEAE